jgi:hypothetical protein
LFLYRTSGSHAPMPLLDLDPDHAFLIKIAYWFGR